MHYKNGRPAKKGDWVVGKTHNSGDEIRVCYVKELIENGGTCNVKLHFWRHNYDYCGGEATLQAPYQYRGEEDYAYTSNLIHIMDGYRLACIACEAWSWDSPISHAPRISG